MFYGVVPYQMLVKFNIRDFGPMYYSVEIHQGAKVLSHFKDCQGGWLPTPEAIFSLKCTANNERVEVTQSYALWQKSDEVEIEFAPAEEERE